MDKNPDIYNSLALAYIGDAIYEIIVREHVISKGNRQVEKMHRETVKFVNAAAQAELAEAIQDKLTDEEKAIYRRGRNATSHTVPKNQSVGDYRKATGLEALIGWLYLKGEYERIMELVGIEE